MITGKIRSSLKKLLIKYCLLLVLFTGEITRAFSQTSLTFHGALHMAKTDNPFLKSVSYNKELAHGDIVTAGLKPNPVLNNQTLQLVNSKYYPADSKFYQPENGQVWWQLTKPFQLNNQRKFKMDVAGKNVTVVEKHILMSKGMFYWMPDESHI